MVNKTTQSITICYLDRSMNTVEELRSLIHCIKETPADFTPYVADQLLRSCEIVTDSIEDYSSAIKNMTQSS